MSDVAPLKFRHYHAKDDHPDWSRVRCRAREQVQNLLPAPIPVWMVIFWGEAFLFFRRLMRSNPFLRPQDDQPPSWDAALTLDLLLLIPLRILVYLFAGVPWIPDIIFAVVLLVRHLLLPPALHERRLMLSILLLGPLYEILLIAAGLYVCQHGVLFGLPVWLAVYWVYIFRVLKVLMDRLEHCFQA